MSPIRPSLALAPSRPDRPLTLVDWRDRRSAELFPSVMTATEARDGQSGWRDAKASALTIWWDHVDLHVADRLLTTA